MNAAGLTAAYLFKSISALARAAAMAVLLVGVALAQTDRGSITGTVSDPAHASIPDATVVARHIQTGTTYDTRTTSTGNYTLPSLPPVTMK